MTSLCFSPSPSVNMTTEWLRFKWGVAKLILQCKTPPIIVPIWHEGFEHILPNFPPYIPQIGKKATVVVGEPIDAEPLLHQLMQESCDDSAIGDGYDDAPKDATLFTLDEEKKILEKYGLSELTEVERTRKKLSDYLEMEMKKLQMRTRALHFS